MTTGKKVGTFFLGFLPLVAAIALQYIFMIPLLEAAVGIGIVEAADAGEIGYALDYFFDIATSQRFMELVELLYAATGVFIFGWWFRKVFFKDHGPVFRTRKFSLLILIGLLLLMIGLQFAVTIVYEGVAVILPKAASDYEELMELAGFDQPSVMTFIYGILIGPIVEELVFRGLTTHYFKRIMPFALANILQAVLFGLYHMNLMQGIYAGLAGLVFGYIMYRGGSILYSILAHIIFNFFGFTEILNIGSESPYYNFIWMPVMVLTLIVGSMLYFGRIGKKEA